MEPVDNTMGGTAASQVRGRWAMMYSTVLLVGFGLLYVLTRPDSLISDGESWVTEARLGDPSRFAYALPSYFLQIPLAGAAWRLLHAVGLSVSVQTVFLSFSLAGTLAAMVFVGLIAGEILQRRDAAWLAAILFGASLNPWTQWNGELSGLAVGFVAAGLYFALRGRIVLPASLWALSVLSQSNFVLATPTFVVAVWMGRPRQERTLVTLRRAASLLVLAGTSSLLFFLVGSWAFGKWRDVASLTEWVMRFFRMADRNVLRSPEVFRAIKGLLTAHTAAGHYWRDILSGRGAFDNPLFLPAAAIGLVLLVMTMVFLVAAAWQRRLALFALSWLLPFHVLFNWWWVPADEEYHTGGLPGFLLLVTAGLVYLGSRMPARRRYTLYAGYAALCMGLNLVTVILPRQPLAADIARAGLDIRRLNEEQGGRAVLVTCDGGNVEAVESAGIEYLRIRSIWKGSVPDIQHAILSWTQDRVAEGKTAYLLDRWCRPEDWRTEWSKQPFDLHFLESNFQLVPTRIVGVPVAQPSVTDPFTWRRADVVRLDSRAGTSR